LPISLLSLFSVYNLVSYMHPNNFHDLGEMSSDHWVQNTVRNATKMILARLWRVCLQMFSSSRHRGFGGRKRWSCDLWLKLLYYFSNFKYHIDPYRMGPPNPIWWMGRSLTSPHTSSKLLLLILSICPIGPSSPLVLVLSVIVQYHAPSLLAPVC
jgi:hypothetical protein